MMNISKRSPVQFSRKLYERLLVLYPARHRQEYGGPMAQLFHDQCRDAWIKARWWGLAILWMRVSIDLARTATLEHLQNARQRKSMIAQIRLLFRANPILRKTFFALFAAGFLLALGTSAVVAFLTPDEFASRARISVEQGATEAIPDGHGLNGVGHSNPDFIKAQIQLIGSGAILGRVVRKLNLAEAWGKPIAGGSLSESDTVKLLKAHLESRPVRNTGLIDIRVFNKNPTEASEIANAVAETYREYKSEKRIEQFRSVVGVQAPGERPVEIVDAAEPGLSPVRPNKPFTLFLGIFGGILLASVVAGMGVLLVLLIQRISFVTPARRSD